VYNTQGQAKAEHNAKGQLSSFYLPAFEKSIALKLLPLGWNTNKHPNDNAECDYSHCLIIQKQNEMLIQSCGHSFHKYCFDKMENFCSICREFLELGIQKNASKFQQRVQSTLKKTNILDMHNNTEDEETFNKLNLQDEINNQVENKFEKLYTSWIEFE